MIRSQTLSQHEIGCKKANTAKIMFCVSLKRIKEQMNYKNGEILTYLVTMRVVVIRLCLSSIPGLKMGLKLGGQLNMG